MTTVDGYQMALQGRAGAALGIAAIGSFIAGTLGTLGSPCSRRRSRRPRSPSGRRSTSRSSCSG